MESLGLFQKDVQSRNKWRRRIKRAKRFTWKMAVKTECVCICETGKIDRQKGCGRPRPARTATNIHWTGKLKLPNSPYVNPVYYSVWGRCHTSLYRHTISDSPTLMYSQNDCQYGGRPHLKAVLFLILVTWLFSGKTLYSPCLPLDVVIVIYRKDSLKSVGRRNRRLAVHDGHKSLIIGIGCPLNHSSVCHTSFCRNTKR